MNLIENWKEAHRWISVRIMGASSALLLTWATLPDEFKGAVPDWALHAGLALLLIAGIGGRLIQQKPKKKPKKKSSKPKAPHGDTQ